MWTRKQVEDVARYYETQTAGVDVVSMLRAYAELLPADDAQRPCPKHTNFDDTCAICRCEKRRAEKPQGEPVTLRSADVNGVA